MKLYSVFDEAFNAYGRVIKGYDTAALFASLKETTDCPSDGVIYVPSDKTLEALPLFDALQNRFYGGMPIQIGYCNGTNTMLNCLEYHRDSELNAAADDIVLLLAKQDEIKDGKLSTSNVHAFCVPAGTLVELYATTLHYAPCSAYKGAGFRVAVILPKGTNETKPENGSDEGEDRLLFAKNKWLIAHEDAPEVENGAYVGLTGDNINIDRLI